MAEYIVDIEDMDDFENCAVIVDKIVRCRDCKRFERRKIDNVPVPLQWCTRYNYITYKGGYCAFGERREE